MGFGNFLSQMGFEPKTVKRNDYWYLSLLRIKNTPSFKIARKLNVWYEHGIGKGETIIDFCCLYFNCSVKDALEKLAGNFSFHQPVYQPQNLPQKKEENPLKILRVQPIKSFALLCYLHSRNVTLEIAKKYVKKVNFFFYDKEYKALGFGNDSGGCEIRNNWFKVSSTPKAITTITIRVKKLLFLKVF